MTKINEGIDRVKDFETYMEELLGVDAMMSEDAVRKMREPLLNRLRIMVRSTLKR